MEVMSRMGKLHDNNTKSVRVSRMRAWLPLFFLFFLTGEFIFIRLSGIIDQTAPIADLNVMAVRSSHSFGLV